MWMKICGKVLLLVFLACAQTSASPIYSGDEPAPVVDTVGVKAPLLLIDPVPQKPVAPPVNLKELACLQKNIYFEARGQGKKGMAAVAAVTLNRADDPRFPETICGVVYQRNQFSWANRGDRQPNLRRPEEANAWKTAGVIAHQALTGTLVHPVMKAQYFHAVHVSPPWSKKFRFVTTIGGHKFYYQPR